MKQRACAGIDLGGTFIKFGLVSASGGIIYKSSTPTPKGRATILKEFATIVKHLDWIAEQENCRLVAIGVGSPGIVNADLGKIVGRSPNTPGWEGAEVKRTLEAAVRLPVVVDNDANTMALAEHRLGAGKGYRSGLYITVGTGIGSGIILDNRIWRGARFAGAEIGHTIIQKDGKPCKCGKRGCVETLAATAAFVEYYGRSVPEPGGVKYIFDRAKAGDRKAAAAIARAADFLACGIGSALELLNPEIVVIGGGIAAGGNTYLGHIRRGIPKYASAACRRKVVLRRALLGNDAGLIGAALQAFDAR